MMISTDVSRLFSHRQEIPFRLDLTTAELNSQCDDIVELLQRSAHMSQWIRMRLPSSGPVFESQAHHLSLKSQSFNYSCN